VVPDLGLRLYDHLAAALTRIRRYETMCHSGSRALKNLTSILDLILKAPDTDFCTACVNCWMDGWLWPRIKVVALRVWDEGMDLEQQN
jgi:hypothetical protein